MQGMTFNLRLKLGQLKGILRIRDIYVFKENSYQFFSDINKNSILILKSLDLYQIKKDKFSYLNNFLFSEK